MFNRLHILKTKGYYPDTILDIGAFKGYWTDSMRKIYDASDFYLFEAIDYKELKRFDKNTKVQAFNVLLSDKSDAVDWFEMRNTGDSMFRELTHHFTNCKVITRDTIDLNTYIKTNNILNNSKNILIKIDCQGAEIPILKGATDILDKTDFILIEMPLFGQYNDGVPNFLEHVQFMDSIGFVPYDIVDNHYLNNFNIQIDMLFINKNHSFNDLIKNK